MSEIKPDNNFKLPLNENETNKNENETNKNETNKNENEIEERKKECMKWVIIKDIMDKYL
jgi:hypothetical protein